MREIKFRVRDIDTKKIVAYEWIGEDDKWMHWLVSSNDGLLGIGAYPGNGPREQYTGLKDSKGVEIYEGDKLSINGGAKTVVSGGVEMRYGCWGFIAPWTGQNGKVLFVELKYYVNMDFCVTTVIGSIHDPEYAELAK